MRRHLFGKQYKLTRCLNDSYRVDRPQTEAQRASRPALQAGTDQLEVAHQLSLSDSPPLERRGVLLGHLRIERPVFLHRESIMNRIRDHARKPNPGEILM